MHQLEHASLLPFPESSIAGTAAAELPGNRLPLAAGAKAIEDATQHDSVGRGRTSTFVVPTNGWSRKQPLDAVPQLVRDIGEFAFHVQRRSMRSRQTTAAAPAAARASSTQPYAGMRPFDAARCSTSSCSRARHGRATDARGHSSFAVAYGATASPHDRSARMTNHSTLTTARKPVTVLSGFLGAREDDASQPHPREPRWPQGRRHRQRYERGQCRRTAHEEGSASLSRVDERFVEMQNG